MKLIRPSLLPILTWMIILTAISPLSVWGNSLGNQVYLPIAVKGFEGGPPGGQTPGIPAVSTATPSPPPATPLSPTPTQPRSDPGLSWTEIDFQALVPAGIHLQACWNSMGTDEQGRVYIGYTSTRDDGRGDFAVFRYDPASGQKRFLGSFLAIAQAAGNLQPGESIPKGHTRMLLAEGKLYMASQGFHDLKQSIDSLPSYRGSHLFAYDPQADTWQDLAAALPGGVVTAHEGIIALNILPAEHLLVGLAHPSSNIVLFDYHTHQLVRIVPGIPWQLGNPLSRELVVTPSGHVYTYRGTEDPAQREETHSVWVYDLYTGEMKDTGIQMTHGFWNNQTQTRDGRKVYISTVNGQLYEFDTATETFTDLGEELPPTDPRTISYSYSLTLSPDEQQLYYVISVIGDGLGGGSEGGADELYAYDRATGQITFVQQLQPGIYTSGDVRDRAHLYFAHFGSWENFWSGSARLMAIHFPGE